MEDAWHMVFMPYNVLRFAVVMPVVLKQRLLAFMMRQFFPIAEAESS